MPPRSLRVAFALAILVASCSVLLARPDRVSDILARAREAIGGEARLRAVTSLSLKASERRIGSYVFATPAAAARMDNRETRSDIEIEIELPARYVLTRTGVGSTFRQFSGILGDRLIAEGTSMGETTPTLFIGGPDLVVRVAATRVRELLRFTLALLLTAPDQYHVEFSDAGEADTATGRADVLDAKGRYDFDARLFFDKQTHHLLMLDYWEPPRQAPAADAPAPQTRPPEKGEPLFKSIEAPPTGNMQIRLAGFRSVDGVMLPYSVTIEAGSVQEWRVSRFKINPTLNWKRFERR